MPVRSSIDAARLAQLASRPGIDPRQWIVKAVVTDVAYDSEHGIFADINFMPDGDIETALVGTAYAGPDFGEYNPLKVDDVVLVAMPLGDPGEGPVIFARLWSATEKPPVEFSAGDSGGETPTNDPTIRIEDGRTLRIVGKQGANRKIELDGGATYEISATGGSRVVITADTSIEITGDAKVDIKSTGPVAVESPQVTLGDALSGFPIARVGLDFVVTSVGPVVISPGAQVEGIPVVPPTPGLPSAHIVKG